MKIEIIECLTHYANSIAETVQYGCWSDEFARKKVKNATDLFLENFKNYIDWDDLTKDEALELGFRKWSKEQPDLYLVPLYLLPILPIGTELTDIFGGKIVHDGKNVYNDNRAGLITYAIEIKEKK